MVSLQHAAQTIYVCLFSPSNFFFFPLSGESATHYLVKNTVKTFKELAVRGGEPIYLTFCINEERALRICAVK